VGGGGGGGGGGFLGVGGWGGCWGCVGVGVRLLLGGVFGGVVLGIGAFVAGVRSGGAKESHVNSGAPPVPEGRPKKQHRGKGGEKRSPAAE